MTDDEEYIKDKSAIFVRLKRLEDDSVLLNKKLDDKIKESLDRILQHSEALGILNERQDRNRGDIEVVKAWVQAEHKNREEKKPVVKRDSKWIAIASVIASVITTIGIILVALIQGFFTFGSGK